MEPLLGLVAAAIAASVAYLVTSERRRAHLRVWRQAAQRAGLAGVGESEGGFFGGEFLYGSSGALQVRLEGYRQGKYARGHEDRRHGPRPRRRRAVAAPRGPRDRDREALHRRAGDRDRRPLVRRRVLRAGAGPARPRDPRRPRRGVGSRASCGGGSRSGSGRTWRSTRRSSTAILEVQVKESGFSSNGERVPEILAGVLDVARGLVAPKDVAGRIAENVGREPEAGARLRGLLALAREFPGHPATRPALLAAREDASEEVRLRAAMALGDEGRETLVGLVTRAGTDDSCAARAISALGASLPEGLAEATLRRALGGAGRPQTGPGVPRGARAARPARGRGADDRGAAQPGPAGPGGRGPGPRAGGNGGGGRGAARGDAAARRSPPQRGPPGDRRDPGAAGRRCARPALARGRGGGRPLARRRRARPAVAGRRGGRPADRGAPRGVERKGSGLESCLDAAEHNSRH